MLTPLLSRLAKKPCHNVWRRSRRHASAALSIASFDVDFNSSLGSGACGVVYSGLHRDTNREVAIKVVSPALLVAGGEEDVSAGISQEKQAFEHVLHAGASHPHVVDLVSCFEGPCSEAMNMGLQVPEQADQEPVHYFVMERLSAESLGDRIGREGGLEEEAAKQATRAISEGIAFLHQQGIAHRDVKPSNVLYASDAQHGDLKLIDFSHSGVMPQENEPDAQWFEKKLGTAGFTAPEVLAERAPYSAKCDVYSLGCTVHAMLASGRLPRRHPRLGTVTTLPESASPEASKFVEALLCPDPEQRPTILEVLNDPWLH